MLEWICERHMSLKENTMSEETVCACPKCVCEVGESAIEVDGKAYCSDICASNHAQGEKECGHCACGK
ncbi:hypothetical protein [Halotalea alkalilenta]|uniref:hypothetical protein n=1 Tax=Halotalea alkalilenta TaxID=376489 RepID=UPI0029529537|nr:hypothetical protein [Halotalea alkalilenta]